MLSEVRSEAKERNEASHYSVQEGEFSRRLKSTNSIKPNRIAIVIEQCHAERSEASVKSIAKRRN